MEYVDIPNLALLWQGRLHDLEESGDFVEAHNAKIFQISLTEFEVWQLHLLVNAVVADELDKM